MHLPTSLIPLVILASVVAPAAHAQAPVTDARATAEERARLAVTDLFEKLCPEQCVLLAIEAQVELEAVAPAAPGFEALEPGARVPVVQSLTAHVVVDSQLPSAFRTQLKGLVATRLRGLAPAHDVNIAAVAFPPRNAPHLEAPEPPQPLSPAQAATGPRYSEKGALAQAPPLPAAETPPHPAAQEALTDSLRTAAPLLTLGALLALTVIVVAALLYLSLQRAAAAPLEALPLEAPLTEPGPPPASAEPSPSSARAEEALAVRARRLERRLSRERSVRNAVVRGALARGELEMLARWMRLVGDGLLEDLRMDAALAPDLGRLAEALEQRASPGESAEALEELEGRILAARLSQAGESVDEAFSFLEGIPADRFLSACRALGKEHLEVVLRFAPASVRAVAFQALTPAEREEVGLCWVRRPEVPTSEALSAAESLRLRLSGSAGGAARMERALSELLDAAGAAEQPALLKRLRGEGGGRVGRGLITEGGLARAPQEILAAALLALPSERAVAYLGGAPGDVRAALLAACPPRVQGELKEELRMVGAVPPESFLAARRELLARVRDEALRSGLSPLEIQSWDAVRPNGG